MFRILIIITLIILALPFLIKARDYTKAKVEHAVDVGGMAVDVAKKTYKQIDKK